MMDEDDVKNDSSDLSNENPSFFDDVKGQDNGGLDAPGDESSQEVPQDVKAARARGGFGDFIGKPLNMNYNKNLEHQRKIQQGRQEENAFRQHKASENVDSPEEAQEENKNNKMGFKSILNKNSKKKDKDDTVKVVGNLLGKSWKIKLILIGSAIAFLALIIFVLFNYSSSSDNKSSAVRGRAYNAECSSITVVESNNGSNGTYDLEEYVAGVVEHEVGGFNNSEVFKAAAIAARTYVLRNHENCTIAGNATRQAFAPTSNEMIIQAVKDTNGNVLMKDGKLISTMYDALAIAGETSTDFILKQQNQHIPKSWVYSHLSDKSIEYYKNHQHGQGMSQWGAYYLATEKGYTGEQILTYYYGNDIEFASIFGVGNYDNYMVATSTGAADQITEPLRNILEKNGTSVEQFNLEMMESVIAAGPGTRYGVVAAVSAVVGRLWEEYHLRLPYTLCGAHYCNIPSEGRNVNKTGGTYYGIDPDWGSYIGNFYYNGGGRVYNYYGPDCSGFVAWALYNGGFSGGIAGANAQGQFGPRYKLSSGFIAQPGDLLSGTGHIMIIIGVDTENHSYYIAHASGGASGVKIDRVDYTNSNDNRYVVDMTNFYTNHVNVSNSEDYRNKFLNNMYT